MPVTTTQEQRLVDTDAFLLASRIGRQLASLLVQEGLRLASAQRNPGEGVVVSRKHVLAAESTQGFKLLTCR